MRRLLALLLAAVLLCTAALAENSALRTTISWQTTPEAMSRYVKLLSSLMPDVETADEDLQDIAAAIAAVMNAMKLYMHYDTAGTKLAGGFVMRDVELFKETAVHTNGYNELRFDLLPGIVMRSQADGNINWMKQVNEASVRAQMEQACADWLSSLPAVTEHGVYDGNTFAGGDTCTTYAFDDASQAALIRALYHPWSLYIASDTQQQAVDSVANALAEQKTYAYQLRKVEKAGQVIGYGLNCYRGEDLVLTVSMNTENPYEIVFSYMIGSEVMYVSLAIRVQEQSREKLAFTADLCLYPTDGGIAYPLVRGSMPLQSLHVEADLTLGKYTNLGTVKTTYEGYTEPPQTELDLQGGFCVGVNVDYTYNIKSGCLDLKADTLIGDEACWTTVISTEEAPAVEIAIGTDETVVDYMQDPDALIDLLTSEGATEVTKEMTVRLFKAVPPEALVYVMQYLAF